MAPAGAVECMCGFLLAEKSRGRDDEPPPDLSRGLDSASKPGRRKAAGSAAVEKGTEDDGAHGHGRGRDGDGEEHGDKDGSDDQDHGGTTANEGERGAGGQLNGRA
ncbi:hypothetical protein GCM10010340_62860 [Streptomyces griseoloalbus]|nr:hypothetical protein GCM10010340_62860 [Streptomyces albaduncus]